MAHLMSEFTILLSESLPKYSDKCIFPPSVLEDALATSPRLPHPLVLALNGSLLVGVKEFTAPLATILVPEEVYKNLGCFGAEFSTVSCSVVLDVERATSLTLKPLQFYPHVTNWKYYLESFLSTSYTTLTKGQTIHWYDTVATQTVSLRVEDSNAPSVIVVDTDIALDVTPLDDIMAAQQLQHGSALAHIENVPLLHQPTVLQLDPFHASQTRHIFKVNLLESERFISVSLVSDGDICNVDLIAGLDKLLTLENYSACTMAQDGVASLTKTLVLDTRADQIANHMEKCKDEPWLYIVPFAWSDKASVTLDVAFSSTKNQSTTEEVARGEQCSNCGIIIDAAKLQLHEAFCSRNNIKCTCGQVFAREIPSSHWHCEFCHVHGNSATFKYKHAKLAHELPYICTQCSLTKKYSTMIELVQQHKSTDCPAKLIECIFCHLIVPQEEANYEDRFANLTHHESRCGNRTAECYQCGKVLRNKDMAKHFQMHALVKSDQSEGAVEKCLNHVCSNVLSEADKSDNDMGLCGTCYGPLYVTQLDRDKSKLQSRIERKYVLQLTKGCENKWCRNPECSISRGKLGIQAALTRVKQVLLPAITHPHLPINGDKKKLEANEFWFCVNQSNQERTNCIDALINEGIFPESLIYRAVSQEGAEGAKVWLQQNALGPA